MPSTMPGTVTQNRLGTSFAQSCTACEWYQIPIMRQCQWPCHREVVSFPDNPFSARHFGPLGRFVGLIEQKVRMVFSTFHMFLSIWITWESYWKGDSDSSRARADREIFALIISAQVIKMHLVPGPNLAHSWRTRMKVQIKSKERPQVLRLHLRIMSLLKNGNKSPI